MPALTRSDLPELFDRADSEADLWKRRFLRIFATQIILLCIGAVAGPVGRYTETPFLTLMAMLCFLFVALLRLHRHLWPTSGRWPRARWVAERTKSLAWSYAVGAKPFEAGPRTPEEVRKRFGDELVDVFKTWKWGSTSPDLDAQITPGMEALRADSSANRLDAFLEGRLAEQRNWYESKAERSETAGRRWDYVFVAASAAAITGGVLQLAELMRFDLLGVAGFGAALVVSWTGLNRHKRQATTYRLAGEELDRLAREAPESADSPDWSHFVHRIETAIRREEAGWLEAHS